MQIDWFALTAPVNNRVFTVMVTVLEIAGLPVVQVSLEVMVQVIELPLTGLNV